MCKGCWKCGCCCSVVARVLLVIGALNWGLVGIGMLLGSDWNVVGLLLGSVPMLEAIVYILVGLAGVLGIFGCRCKKCLAACASCQAPASGSEMKM